MNQSHAEAQGSQRDPLYERARDLVVSSQRCTISMLQREYYIGYVRASQIVQSLIDAGVVDPRPVPGGAFPVLISASPAPLREDGSEGR